MLSLQRKLKKGKMADNEYGWFALRYWAEKLEKKYPRTNLLSLSNKELSRRLLSLKEAKGMPPLPNDKSYFYALACAWVDVQHGGSEPKAIPDAYI